MPTPASNHDNILSALGLPRKATHLNHPGFQRYVPPKYIGSELEDRDAVHRMSEIALLHLATGLRFSYLETESYDGDSVEYSLLGIEAITNDGQEHKVVDVDFEKQSVVTEDEVILFADLSRKLAGDLPG